ncbi:Ig-like domain-containing protein [Legionella sainthelensi]|uniref:Ig-like domain-containing protein n=1 Tax=Legionella sainthelensi TaxID=28087 RepID=UPI000E20A131|nr:Ig-like domain-containing protein [Legionella sainthelensi]
MNRMLTHVFHYFILGITLLFMTTFLHAGAQPKFSIVATTPTTKQVSATGHDTVQYRVTNNTNIIRTLTMNPIRGIHQVLAGGCSNPFTLAPKASCLLTLRLDGSELPERVTGGPEICKTKGPGDNSPDAFLCSRPSAADSLNLAVVSSSRTLVSIAISPSNPKIANKTSLQFVAIGIFSNGTTQDISNRVNWSSSSPNIASISNDAGSKGLATGNSPGTTTITASLGTTSASTLLTVSSATLSSIAVTPVNRSIPNGTTLQYAATGTFSNGTTQDLTAFVTWTSLDETRVSISNTAGSKGLATGNAPGTTIIRATLNNTIGETNLTVTAGTLTSIAVTPTNPSIPNGFTQQFTAMGTFSGGAVYDITNLVAWTSSTNAASISNAPGSHGLAVGTNTGTTTITAQYAGITGTTTLTVTAATLTAIDVTPVDPSIVNGTNQQFTAVGIFSNGTHLTITPFVTWSSSDTTKATISNAPGSHGLASAVGVGSTTITASVGSMSGSSTLTITAATLTSIEVTPVNTTLVTGSTLQYTATGIYNNDTTQDLTQDVTWTSSSPAIANISNAPGSKGDVYGNAAGSVTISASLSGVSGSTGLTVTAPTLQSITVTPNNASLANGLTLQYTATGNYSDGSMRNLTQEVVWSSTSTNIATVSNSSNSKGLATATAQGATTITASYNNITGSTSLTVTAATLSTITVEPSSASIVEGTTKQYSATGHFTDNSEQDLTSVATWTSSNSTIASVSNVSGSEGLATGNGVGTATISATQNSVTGTATLNVTAATLQSIKITGSGFVPVGESIQLTAVGTYDNGTTQNITTLVTWSSDNPFNVSVSNAVGSQGLATGNNPGTTNIRANLNGHQGITPITATTTQVTSVYISTANNSIVHCQVLNTGLFNNCVESASVFSSPQGLAINSVGTFIYIANSVAGIANGITKCTVTGGAFINCSQAASTGTQLLGFNPYGIALNDAVGNPNPKAYVTTSTHNNVLVCPINTGTNNLDNCIDSGINFTTFPAYDISLNDAGTMAYVTSPNTNQVSLCMINSITGLFDSCTQLSSDWGSPLGIALQSSNLGLYVSSVGENLVSYCSLNSDGTVEYCLNASPSPIAGVSFAGPIGIVVGKNNQVAYIANSLNSVSNPISVCPIDADTQRFGACSSATSFVINSPQFIALL